MIMEKWEYKQQTSEFQLGNERNFIDWFNEEGQQGWEVISFDLHASIKRGITYECRATFKRKIYDQEK